MKRERLYGMDLVRVCALILILVYHFNIYLGEGEELIVPFISQDSMGAVGVGLYLIISGAALAYNYDGFFRIGEFYKRRIITLMLPFWIAYIFVLIFNFIMGIKGPSLPLWRYIFTIIGMDGYLSYRIPTFYLIGEWFLGFIIICYILFPLYKYCVKRIPWIFATVFMIMFLYNITTYKWEIPLLWNPLILTPFFVLGIYFVDYIFPIKKDLFFAAVLGAYACDRFIFTNIMNDILVGTFFLFLIIFYIGERVGKARVILAKASKYSYGVILFHHIVMERASQWLNIEWFSSYKKYMTFLIICLISIGLSVLLNMVVKTCTENLERMLK